MRVRRFELAAALLTMAMSGAAAWAADDYTIDGAHTSVYFKVSHGGFSDTHGRFNDVSGKFTIAAGAAQTAFNLTIKTDSVDTGNAQRDTHLRKPDFFNSPQYPVITFKSTSVKGNRQSYEVSGDLTMHGVSRPVKFTLKGGKVAEFPKGVERTGYSATLDIKRSDFGMDKMLEAIGDEVHISIGIEGTRPTK